MVRLLTVISQILALSLNQLFARSGLGHCHVIDYENANILESNNHTFSALEVYFKSIPTHSGAGSAQSGACSTYFRPALLP